ncbi:MAG: hypothetical protein V4449_00415 [Patescibacteria group bacterium]
MELTVLLSRVFGVYLLIMAVAIFTRRKALMVSVEAMFKEQFAQLVAAMISILGGLIFINIYQDWSSVPAGIISTIAWLILIKGLLYAFLPEVRLAEFTKLFTERGWYTMDGLLALSIGIYLTGFGYGLW